MSKILVKGNKRLNEHLSMTLRKCHQCGKKFIPAPYHVYRDNSYIYCSYNCKRNHDKRNVYSKKKNDEEFETKPHYNAKPVDCFSLDGKYIKTYPSAGEAARILNPANQKKMAQTIRNCCNGTTKTSCGFTWRFHEETKK